MIRLAVPIFLLNCPFAAECTKTKAREQLQRKPVVSGTNEYDSRVLFRHGAVFVTRTHQANEETEMFLDTKVYPCALLCGTLHNSRGLALS